VKMSADLARRHLRSGILDTDIASLLGVPDKRWPPENGESHDVYEYDMGHAPMDFAGQHFVFRIHFDQGGRLASTETTRD